MTQEKLVNMSIHIYHFSRSAISFHNILGCIICLHGRVYHMNLLVTDSKKRLEADHTPQKL